MTKEDCLGNYLGYCKFSCTAPESCNDFKNRHDWIRSARRMNNQDIFTSSANLTPNYCIKNDKTLFLFLYAVCKSILLPQTTTVLCSEKIAESPIIVFKNGSKLIVNPDFGGKNE